MKTTKEIYETISKEPEDKYADLDRLQAEIRELLDTGDERDFKTAKRLQRKAEKMMLVLYGF